MKAFSSSELRLFILLIYGLLASSSDMDLHAIGYERKELQETLSKLKKMKSEVKRNEMYWN